MDVWLKSYIQILCANNILFNSKSMPPIIESSDVLILVIIAAYVTCFYILATLPFTYKLGWHRANLTLFFS